MDVPAIVFVRIQVRDKIDGGECFLYVILPEHSYGCFGFAHDIMSNFDHAVFIA